MLPVREVVRNVQDVGLKCCESRLSATGQAGRQQLDLDYSGEPSPEVFVQLLERLQGLAGVHRLTTAVAATSANRPASSALGQE